MDRETPVLKKWNSLPPDAPQLLQMERSVNNLQCKLVALERSLQRKLDAAEGKLVSNSAKKVKTDIKKINGKIATTRELMARTERNMKKFRPGEYLAYRIYRFRFFLRQAEERLAKKLQANGGRESQAVKAAREEISGLRNDLEAARAEWTKTKEGLQ